MSDCLFCKIASREIPSIVVYEDEDTFAFLDIGPVNLGHVLVIPKAHTNDILEMDEAAVAALYAKVRRIAPAVMEGVSADGINVAMNVRSAAGQEVFHTHAHIIPRFTDDGLVHWGKRKVTNDQLAEAGERIAAALAH
jgi:histidine triad (HIT) family protein